MPLWPLHFEIRNLTLPVKFMISQGIVYIKDIIGRDFIHTILGLELAPIDSNTLVLTNFGYSNVYRINYDPFTWQQIVTRMSNFSEEFSPVARAQIVNDFCYFHSLG